MESYGYTPQLPRTAYARPRHHRLP